MPGHIKHLIRSDRGVAAIEAAMILPIMIFFIFGTIEIYQYFRAAAILDRAAFSVADGIAMQTKLVGDGPCNATDHLCTYGVVVGDLMRPVDYKNKGRMTIRLFGTDTDASGVTSWTSGSVWGWTCAGDGNCLPGAAGSLPSGIPAPAPKDTLLVVQVFQIYEPFLITSRLWSSLGGSTELSTTAFYRPRFEDLKTLN
ncbi:TadE family protein [Castellaniella sp. MT123]|uniref:TadE/TadG family type IV pilus assembly protein n=1 Tax=Castellaniella sp. MT123 TaxID=3140381 RepID=UPI0031F3C9C5